MGVAQQFTKQTYPSSLNQLLNLALLPSDLHRFFKIHLNSAGVTLFPATKNAFQKKLSLLIIEKQNVINFWRNKIILKGPRLKNMLNPFKFCLITATPISLLNIFNLHTQIFNIINI